jgi:hypothetical protein
MARRFPDVCRKDATSKKPWRTSRKRSPRGCGLRIRVPRQAWPLLPKEDLLTIA